MRIHCIVKANQAPDYHRIIVPMMNMKLAEGDECNVTFTGEETDELWDCDILMFNRDIKTSASELSALRDIFGFKIVLDMDDYWELPGSHMLYNSWKERGMTDTLIKNIKIADVVITTTEALATQVRKYNVNTVIIPNCLEVPEKAPNSQNKTRFIYTGGTTHKHDLKQLEGKIRRISDDKYIKDNAIFKSTYYRDLFRLTGSFEPIEPLPLDQYMDCYNEGDVALIPLTDNLFNSCKSELKIIEAGIKGLACIVSDVAPYNKLKGYPGLLWVTEPGDWLKHIRFCIKNRDWVENEGRNLRRQIRRDFNLDYYNKRRYEIFCGILHQ